MIGNIQCRTIGVVTVAVFVGVAAALASACGGDSGGEESTPQVIVVTPTGSATPRVRRTPTPTPAPPPTPVQSCAANPDPASPKLLQVQEPLPNTQVKVPVHVRGWGSQIGQNDRGVAVSVVDVKQSVVQVNNLPPLPREFRVAPPGMEVTEFTRPFAADIVLNNVTAPTPYCLWVYLETTQEGRARGVVQIPVVIAPQ
jgi:hypothetical protein